MKPPVTWRRRLFIAAAVCFFLGPAMFGFVNKFLELVALVEHEEGAFTVMPLVNYLLASVGFFLLFVWATCHGMFHAVEQPKHAMLERERLLDAADPHET